MEDAFPPIRKVFYLSEINRNNNNSTPGKQKYRRPFNQWFELVQRGIFAAIFSWNGNLYLQHLACAQENEEWEWNALIDRVSAAGLTGETSLRVSG